MLFALPALRNSQPYIGTFGTIGDVVGFFWNITFVSLSFVVLSFFWIMEQLKNGEPTQPLLSPKSA
jgi:ABC-type uncharacterized transport system permease subunit